jgi:tetratricopeptide (TPR) repeat protein
MRPALTHGWLLSLSCSLALTVGACQQQRALPAVQESGDRAFRRQNFDAAATDYKEYVTRHPGDPAVHLKLAKTLLELKQPAEAVEHAQMAYDQRTTNDECIETLARALFESGRQEDWHRLLKNIADGRGLPGDHIRLGRYLALAGDADNAEQALKQAARVDGGRTIQPQMALADFYHTIGDKPNELKRLRMALFIDPNNVEVLKRLRALGEVPGPSLAIAPEETVTTP